MKQAEAKNEEVKKLFDAEDTELKKDPNFKMSDADREKVKTLNKEIEDLEQKAADEIERSTGRSATEERAKRYRTPTGSFEQPSGAEKGKEALSVVRKTLGELFTEDPTWQAFMKEIAPEGNVSTKRAVASPPFKMPSFLPGKKAVVTGGSSTSGGAFVVNERDTFFERTPFAPFNIFDLITRRGTRSDTIEYVRQTSRTNNAAPVAEATASGGGTGTKPESAFALEIVTTVVKTIAHWIPATKRALSDALQVRGIIDDELIEGLLDEMADQILNGDGLGENFTGIAATTGTTQQAWDTNILTTTRKARTKVRTVGRASPTGYVLHPTDWETIDLLQDNEARYYFGGPSVLGTPRLWGLPVAEEERKTQGEGLVGDMRQCVLWDRADASISVSDSHADFFIRNLVAILAEQRAGFGIRRPAALVEIDLTA